MSTTELARDLKALTDGELDEAAAIWPAEARREKQRRYAKAHRAEIRAEWELGQYALYLQAESECRGELLNRAGEAAGIDPWTLFFGVERRVNAYASEELKEFFYREGRITVEEYTRQRARGAEGPAGGLRGRGRQRPG